MRSSSRVSFALPCVRRVAAGIMSFVLLPIAFPSIAAAQEVISGYAMSTLAEGAPFIGSGGISVAPDGRVFVVDAFGNDISGDRVFEVTPQGVVTSIFEPPGDCFFTIGEIEATEDGGFLVWSACRQDILSVTSDGISSLFADFSSYGGGGGAEITAVLGMARDGQSNLFAGSPLTDQIFLVSPEGEITTYVTSAQVEGGLHNPVSLAIGPAGDLLIVDTDSDFAEYCRVLRVSPGGETTLLAEGAGMNSVAYDKVTGDVYAGVERERIIRIDPSGAIATIATGFTRITSLAYGRSTSGMGESLFVSQEGLSIDATDGDAIFEIRSDRCSAGSVNSGVGPVEDVLFVNGSAGAPYQRTVIAPIGEQIDVELFASSAGPPNATYVIWVWLGSTTRPTDLSIGSRLGCTVNPTPLNAELAPQPIACVRGAGVPRVACGASREILVPFGRLPWPRPLVHPGFGQPVQLRLQGVIKDFGSASPLGFSVTNAIILKVE